MKKLMNILKSKKGQGMVEYGLILALVAVVAIASLTLLGSDITALFGKAGAGLK